MKATVVIVGTKAIVAQITVSSEVGVGLAVSAIVTMASAIGIIYRQMVANQEIQLKATRDDFTAQIVSLTANFDKQLAALNADRNSWKEMSEELAINIEKSVNRRRAALGKPPFDRVEAVVPEHQSPVKSQQQETADIASMRARLVAAAKELGEDPRLQPPPATAQEEAESIASAPDKAAQEANALIAESERKTTVTDAMHDAKGAIEVAKVAVEAATVVIEETEANKNPDTPKETTNGS